MGEMKDRMEVCGFNSYAKTQELSNALKTEANCRKAERQIQELTKVKLFGEW